MRLDSGKKSCIANNCRLFAAEFDKQIHMGDGKASRIRKIVKEHGFANNVFRHKYRIFHHHGTRVDGNNFEKI